MAGNGWDCWKWPDIDGNVLKWLETTGMVGNTWTFNKQKSVNVC